eukprot:14260-Eustigmatos_ZCMA.PRE.1
MHDKAGTKAASHEPYSHLKCSVWHDTACPHSTLVTERRHRQHTHVGQSAVVSAALETGRMELVLWSEGAGARMPKTVEPAVMRKA